MKKLHISHIGPIKEATIELKRFNFFIGPQSSGKSTIAKVISVLSWLEKEACTTLSNNILPEGVTFKKYVEDFHRIHGYIDETKSLIEYESDFVKIRYANGKFSLELKEEAINYKRVKVLYVPSDRNVITIPDIELRNLEGTNFRSFLFDWLDCHKHYDQEHKVEILDLGVNYYFDASAKERNDKITHANGVTYNIPLYDASSGLQSVVPLVVLMEYLTTQYFQNYGKETSFAFENKKNLLTHKLCERYLLNNPSKSVMERFYETRDLFHNGDVKARETIETIVEKLESLSQPHSISFILEEPEQNLYPQTQVDVLKNIITCCNRNNQNSAVVTTHSPYVINYLNVLLRRPVDSSDCISADDLSVHLINEGRLLNLMKHDRQREKWAVDSSSLSEAMNSMYQEYQAL